MIIGIDFDNTIACHDESFMKVALDEGFSIKDDKNAKQQLKMSYLEQKSGNLLWTQAQGKVYGKEISSAKLFQGFVDFIEKARSLDHEVFIISHRTIFPASGEPIDLHKAAFEWLQAKGLLSPQRILRKNCFFETTLEKKLERIGLENCDLFIDDLREVIEHERFPENTKGILFGKEHESLKSMLSWNNAEQLLDCPGDKKQIPTSPSTTLPVDLHEESFCKLLNLADSNELRLEILKGGGNNRAYKIYTNEEIFMGKVYFRNPSDTRNRLFHETSFSEHLRSQNLKRFPQLIAKDEKLGIAVFEWLSGQTFESNSTTNSNHWEQCLEFLSSIQVSHDNVYAKHIPNASESAFSLREHWGILQNRHDFWRSRALRKPDSIPEPIKDFLLNDLELKYQELARAVLIHPDFNRVMSREERILSPSDFGLHNAILQKNGTLSFYDFEYAGWDDPAKTIADFFAQPTIPPPSNLYHNFKDTIMSLIAPEKKIFLLNRLRLVEEIIRIKWCYIIMNNYHPEFRKRRELSGNSSKTLKDHSKLTKLFRMKLQNQPSIK